MLKAYKTSTVFFQFIFNNEMTLIGFTPDVKALEKLDGGQCAKNLWA